MFPDIPLNLLLALLFSSLLAVGAAVVSDILDKTIRDPEQVARTLHTEVVGSLPLMKTPALAGAARPRCRLVQEGGKGGTQSDSEDDLSGFHESRAHAAQLHSAGQLRPPLPLAAGHQRRLPEKAKPPRPPTWPPPTPSRASARC